jgi:transposase
MTNREPTPAGAVLVAIDISKARNDVLIEVPGSPRRRRLIVLNTRTEHDRFVTLLASFGTPVIAGFEATGNYHRPLAFRLLEAGIALRLISSVALARTREALHNGWDKNDPKDAQVILHMLRIGATQTYVDPLVTGINDIQELSKTHEVISKAKTELWHRLLTHYLPLYFPEIARFAGNSRSDWFLAFLAQFPTPARLFLRESRSLPIRPVRLGQTEEARCFGPSLNAGSARLLRPKVSSRSQLSTAPSGGTMRAQFGCARTAVGQLG